MGVIRLKKILVISALSLAVSACQPRTNEISTSCAADPNGVVQIDAAKLVLGNNKAYPEERERAANIKSFDIDKFEVTNAQFAQFIKETGYVTTAEKPQLGFNVPGAAVFKPPSSSQENWWQFVEGANWRHPEGPGSSIDGRDNEPAVQVSQQDALAYAKWAGRDLPSEGEWEHAAKSRSKTLYVWGDERAPNGKEMANTWQGAFPIKNTVDDGFPGIAPVGCFPANPNGLYDMIGNVWEWTKTDYSENAEVLTYTIKGGSYLCAENYCARYRASARQPQEADFSTNHIGFRTVSRKTN